APFARRPVGDRPRPPRGRAAALPALLRRRPPRRRPGRAAVPLRALRRRERPARRLAQRAPGRAHPRCGGRRARVRKLGAALPRRLRPDVLALPVHERTVLSRAPTRARQRTPPPLRP